MDSITALNVQELRSQFRLQRQQVKMYVNDRPQRSCGKVMFLQACVKNSVHRGACMAGRGEGCVWQGGMHDGGVHGRWGHVWHGGMCGRGHVW